MQALIKDYDFFSNVNIEVTFKTKIYFRFAKTINFKNGRYLYFNVSSINSFSGY